MRGGNWLLINLRDMAESLDQNLRRRHNASCTAELLPGRVVLAVTGADRDVLTPYMDSFRQVLAREGYKMFVNYGRTDC